MKKNGWAIFVMITPIGDVWEEERFSLFNFVDSNTKICKESVEGKMDKAGFEVRQARLRPGRVLRTDIRQPEG